LSKVSRCNSASASARVRTPIAGCNGLDLGIGKFLSTDVLGPACGVVAGDDLADESGLGFSACHI